LQRGAAHPEQPPIGHPIAYRGEQMGNVAAADPTSIMLGYMHIRFDNNMLISLRSEPEDDIIERNDPSYVYLKPYGADDEAIRQQWKFSGPPPVYIPMPPH
jgi:hypothetical protein